MFAHSFFILSFTIAVNSVTGLQPVDGRIKITIGTTGGSMDTATFIHEQLDDVYSEYSNSLDIEFVPWGRTVRDVTGKLTCQFGEKDCWANRIQRCALSLLTRNQTAQLNYMKCEFSPPFPSYVLTSFLCAQSVGVHNNDLENCVADGSDEIDRVAEAAARLPIQIINFIPSISINDIHDFGLHNEAIKNLSKIIADAFADPITEKPTTFGWY